MLGVNKVVKTEEKVQKEKVQKENEPREKGPKEKVPMEKVPKEKVPKEKVPKEKVPKEKVLKEKGPKEKVPMEKVLKEKVSKEKVLKEKVLKEKVPEERIVAIAKWYCKVRNMVILHRIGPDADASSLPMQLITWIVNTTQIKIKVGDSDVKAMQSLVMIEDSDGFVVCVYSEKHGKESPKQQLTKALHKAMYQPTTWVPRRPANVKFANEPSLTLSELAAMGIRDNSKTMDCGCVLEHGSLNVRTCFHCRRFTGEKRLFTPCPGCGAMLYCSEDCFKADIKYRHGVECRQMKLDMQGVTELADLPFTFTLETTSENFGSWQYTMFLKRYGVYGKGFWLRERHAHCWKHVGKCNFGDLDCGSDPYVLSGESAVLSTSPRQTLTEPLTGWKDYYMWRGFELSSPIAIVLTLPLTIYHMINLFPQHYPAKRPINGLAELTIHIIGAELEVDLVGVFEELNYLLPGVKVQLLLVGPEMSNKVNGKTHKMGNVTVNIKKALYHNIKAARPDVVMGFNVGLGAYKTWFDTLIKLKVQGLPAFFTDYCHYSCNCARLMTRELGLTISDITVNPFRKPVWKYCQDHVMPWYSNGFMFSLQY